jgi:hypothetical protein
MNEALAFVLALMLPGCLQNAAATKAFHQERRRHLQSAQRPSQTCSLQMPETTPMTLSFQVASRSSACANHDIVTAASAQHAIGSAMTTTPDDPGCAGATVAVIPVGGHDRNGGPPLDMITGRVRRGTSCRSRRSRSQDDGMKATRAAPSCRDIRRRFSGDYGAVLSLASTETRPDELNPNMRMSFGFTLQHPIRCREH